VEILKYLLIVVEVLCGVLLIGAILLQRTKSQGMGGMAFGAAMGETLFGPQVGTVLTKATVILAVVFLLNTTALALMGSRQRPASVTAGLPQKTEQMPPGTTPTPPVTATAPIPETPAPETPAPPTPAPQTPTPPAPTPETPPKTTP
jgi:preprotein translocase subunit SecG